MSEGSGAHARADGYNISQDANTKTPSYAQVSFSNQADYTWASSTSDGRAQRGIPPEVNGNC